MTDVELDLGADLEIEGLEETESTAIASSSTSGIAGFVVVRVHASPSKRNVIAAGYVNGVLVATASAADQSAGGVISSPTQSFTLPVPNGSKVRFRTNLSKPAGHVFARYFKA